MFLLVTLFGSAIRMPCGGNLDLVESSPYPLTQRASLEMLKFLSPQAAVSQFTPSNQQSTPLVTGKSYATVWYCAEMLGGS